MFAMKSRGEVVTQVRAKIRMLHFAMSTEDAYCGWIGRYYDYCRGLDGGSPERKAEGFLTYLATEREGSARTQNQAFAALLFLYKDVLGRPLGQVEALRAKRPHHERISPSRDQVLLLRNAVEDTESTPARLLVDLLYGCGLRVSEPLELRIKDLLWDEGAHGHLVVRGAKGGKDRRVPIPRFCVQPLRRQVERARMVWNWDRGTTPSPGVPLPFSLAGKYPRAPFLWQWFWVFPARHPCVDPRTGVRVR
jgi:integrase